MLPKPLIFTTKGNVLVDTLRHEVEWKHKDEQIIFIESYYLGSELVKQSSHVYILTGTTPPTGVANI
jgi:hypothetical protein